ncbi:hypothetical protein LQR31_00820 [Chromobacterium vaccinii]|uniref:hypothetical protein n=1 Tax=Chromobacterium vaccinii TaxID=1108595 RepID=UPI001E3F21D6|nr:hypothetical protein [Chromobacterium vaccinii]MCD4483019.1 hypothetical protein [Chromobacterium vaccinii]
MFKWFEKIPADSSAPIPAISALPWLRPFKRDKLAALLIALPLLLTSLYFATLSQDRYVSEAKVVVKRGADDKASSLDLGALLGGGVSTLREDAMLLQQYIRSSDMLTRLDQALNLKQAFGQPAGWDWFYRLPSDAVREDFLDYYRNRVDVQFDDKTSLLVIRSQGFTPEFAQKLNRAILAESERFINELSHKISREDMAFAQREVDSAYTELSRAREKLLAYQNRNGLIDPHAQAQAAGQLVAELEGKQAQMEAELRNLQSYLQSDSPQVVSARNALDALKTQIVHEKAKLASPNDGKLNRKASQFQEMRAWVEFRTDLYRLALTALEKAKVAAAHKQKSLAVISSPQLPELAEYPRRLYTLASLLLITSLLYGIARLALSIIEDHKI